MSKFNVGDTVKMNDRTASIMREAFNAPELVIYSAAVVRILGDNGKGETLYELDVPNKDHNTFAETHLVAA